MIACKKVFNLSLAEKSTLFSLHFPICILASCSQHNVHLSRRAPSLAHCATASAAPMIIFLSGGRGCKLFTQTGERGFKILCALDEKLKFYLHAVGAALNEK